MMTGGSWRTRVTGDRSLVRHMLHQPNPFMPPYTHRLPQNYPLAPAHSAAYVAAYREALRTQVQAQVDAGDTTQAWMLDWLQPDPLPAVREQLRQFLADFDPNAAPLAPLTEPAVTAAMDQALAAASDPYRYTPVED